MSKICPYNKKVICDYLPESPNSNISYHCDECPHYAPSPTEEEDAAFERASIVKLFVYSGVIIAVVFVIAFTVYLIKRYL